MGVTTENVAGCLVVSIARPQKRNALTRAMYAAMADALELAADDHAVRVVLLRGEGADFCAGNDIGDFQTSDPHAGVSHTTRFLHAISAFPKPIVAAVQGNAVGIGTTMLLHCDIVVLAASARLSLPFVSLALVPEAASSLLLPRLIGARRASRMLLLGERIDAATAERWGLASETVADASLAATAQAHAARLSGMAPAALAHTKALLRGDVAILHARMAEEAAIFAAQLRSPEAREALAAFMEKRPADFTTRAG